MIFCTSKTFYTSCGKATLDKSRELQDHTQSPAISYRRLHPYIINILILLQPAFIYPSCHAVFREKQMHETRACTEHITRFLIFELQIRAAVARMLVINEMNWLHMFVYAFIHYKFPPIRSGWVWRESDWCVASPPLALVQHYAWCRW